MSRLEKNKIPTRIGLPLRITSIILMLLVIPHNTIPNNTIWIRDIIVDIITRLEDILKNSFFL